MSEIRHSLSKIGKENIQSLYNYSITMLGRLQDRFTALDSKASQTISLIAVIVGILALTSPSINLTNNKEVKIVLFVSILCFIIAILCCLMCLLIRSILEPPMIEVMIYNWIKEFKNTDTKECVDLEMLSATIIDFANTEKSYLKIYRSKATYLFIGQFFEIIGIVFLMAFLVIFLVISRKIF